MIPNSLRFRLFASAGLVIFVALQVAGAALLMIYERSVLRQVDLELNAYIEQLAANVSRAADGGLELPSELAEPRFRQPLAGRYWQIQTGNTFKLKSLSLWETELAVPMPEPQQGVRYQKIRGPDKQVLYAAARTVLLDPEVAGQPDLRVGLIAAMDAGEVETLKRQFLGDLVTALGLLAILLLAAAWVQVQVGLHPFELLRTGLERIRLGMEKRLAGDMPSEIEPLVAETNRLLEAQEKVIERARARAGDLAHGVKTPLTALTILAQQLRDEGRVDLGSHMDHHLSGIRDQVERELARARTAAGAGVAHRTEVEPVVTRLARTMRSLPRGDELEWAIRCDAGLQTTLDEADLVEVLGNLLDNARKWARSIVEIEGRNGTRNIEIRVSDDGPSVPAGEQERILRRGIRLDETKPGSGLGLSIVSEIVETYGGTIELGRSAANGLCVYLTLPAQSRP